MSWDIPQPLCPLPDRITGPERKVRKVHTLKKVNSIPFLLRPHRPTALYPLQQPGRQPQRTDLPSCLALTPLGPMGTPTSPQCSHRTSPAGRMISKLNLRRDSFEAIGTMMCTGLGQVQAPRTESKRKTECPCQCHGEYSPYVPNGSIL